MKVASWSSPQEIKELMCGNKMVVTACMNMDCPWFYCIDYDTCGLLYMEPAL